MVPFWALLWTPPPLPPPPPPPMLADLRSRIASGERVTEAVIVSYRIPWGPGPVELYEFLASDAVPPTLRLRVQFAGGFMPEGVAAAGLARNTTITSLDMSNCPLDGAGLASLGGALRASGRIRALSLRNAPWRHGADVAPIVALLADSSCLTTLDLSACHIGPATATALAGALRVNSTLTSLDLASNSGMVPAGLTSLAAAVLEAPALTHLDVSGLGMDAGCAAQLARLLRCSSTLLSLCAAGNGLYAGGVSALAAALARNSTLTALNIGSNYAGEGGLGALGLALAENSTLVSLVAGTNGPNRGGDMAPFAAGLARARLTSLEIDGCGFRGAAVAHLAGGALRGLRRLDFSRNRTSDADALLLARGLASAHALEELLLEQTDLSAAALGAFTATLATLRRLHTAILLPLADGTAPLLAALLRANAGIRALAHSRALEAAVLPVEVARELHSVYRHPLVRALLLGRAVAYPARWLASRAPLWVLVELVKALSASRADAA